MKTILLSALAAFAVSASPVGASDLYNNGGRDHGSTQYQGGDVVTQIYVADRALVSTFGNLDLRGCATCGVGRQEQNGAVVTKITKSVDSHITNAGNASSGAPRQDQYSLVLVKIDHLKGGSVLNAGNIAGLP